MGPNNSGKSNILKLLLLLKQTFRSSLEAPLILNGNIVNLGSYRNISYRFKSQNIHLKLYLKSKSPDVRRFFISDSESTNDFLIESEYYFDRSNNNKKIKYYSIINKKNRSKIYHFQENGKQNMLYGKSIEEYNDSIISELEILVKNLENFPKIQFKNDKIQFKFKRDFEKLADRIFLDEKESISFLKGNFKEEFINNLKHIGPPIDQNSFGGPDKFGRWPGFLTEPFLDLYKKRLKLEIFIRTYTNLLTDEQYENLLIEENKGKILEIAKKIKDSLHKIEEIQEFLESAQMTLRSFERFVYNLFEKVYYIGPLRKIPQRYYTLTGKFVKDIGKRGELMHLVLKNSLEREEYRHVKKKINKWLEIFEMAKGTKIYQYEEISEFISIIFSEYYSNLNVNIFDMGIGTSQILPIIIEGYLIEKGSLYLVEQPEIHLHPKAQSNLGDLFIDLSKEGKKLIIETHSEHLFKRIQRRIAEGIISHEDVIFYYITMTKEGSKIQKLELDENGLIEKLPEGFFAEDYQESLSHMDAILKKNQE